MLRCHIIWSATKSSGSSYYDTLLMSDVKYTDMRLLRNPARSRIHRPINRGGVCCSVSLGHILSTGLILLLTLSCSKNPVLRVDVIAEDSGFGRSEIAGTDFRHVLYTHLPDSPVDTVHVYLGGDGSPWNGRYRVNTDPTPRNPVALKLMAADPSPSVYLGRPCYHGFAGQPPCTPADWTGARYSEAVVGSLFAALETLIQQYKINNIILIGYSGGGTLAMLLARRLEQTRAVITVAGNLDTDGWTALHGYTPLYLSMNPKTEPALPGGIFQLHLSGELDKVIPPSLTRSAIDSSNVRNVKFEIIEGFDHACCWVEHWPEILSKFFAGHENNHTVSKAWNNGK